MPKSLSILLGTPSTCPTLAGALDENPIGTVAHLADRRVSPQHIGGFGPDLGTACRSRAAGEDPAS
jgi:hypothetical protein